jgi:hypothetical protein
MSEIKRVPALLLYLLAFLALATIGACRRPAEPARPVRNLRALAKLYGCLRYFHPSDEAARVDWDALAVHAAGKVKDAPDDAALAAALEQVFRPVAPSMTLRQGNEAEPAGDATATAAPTPPDVDSKRVSWQHLGVGTGSADSIYVSLRLNRPFEPTGQATLGGHGIDVSEHAGKTVKMSAWVKAVTRGSNSQAQLWLRVDRSSGRGFFDNMSDRPIRTAEWAEYTIAGPLAADARRVAFGALVSGKGEFIVDGFRLSVTDASGREEALAVQNGGFEEGEAGPAPLGWGISSPAMDSGVREGDCREGKRAFAFASKVQPYTMPLFEKRAPADGVADRELVRGLSARIPLSLGSDETGTIPRAAAGTLDALTATLDVLARAPLSGRDESVRLGDVIIAWNVFQHFYPYFDVVEVDWDAVLTRALERALADRTEEDLLRTLNWLVARLEDGHGGVYHALQAGSGLPPFRVEWIEDRAVVTASRLAAFERGDVVLAIDDRSAADIVRDDEVYLSGSPQWRRVRAMGQFGLGKAGARSLARLRRGRETLEVPFERATRSPVAGPPARAPIDRLEEGIFYVYLSRASWPDIEARIGELAAARGIVFDLRGYPNGNHQVLSHLLREPDRSSAWMKIPLVVLPDREGWTFQEIGWNLPTASPRIEGRVVFLTDGRAISYAESFLSFVEHYKLGEIVGEPTAGANGNVNPFTLPGGYSVSWTGMRVVKHDGSRHHTIGVLPTVPVRRTVAGVAAGRDELLEKALEVIKR